MTKQTVIESGFGPHIMLDLSECNVEKLDNLEHCFNLLYALPEQIGMTKITQPNVFPYEGLVPEDRGITGVVIIAESHLSIHTFPLKKYAFIDIFSCKGFDTDAAIQYCIDHFESQSPEVHMVRRGLSFPRHATLEKELVTAD